MLQRHVTGRYFQKITASSLQTPASHLEHFKSLPKGAVALEFGCGRNLLTPLLLSHAGATKVYAYDLERLASIEQINGVLTQLRALVPAEWPYIGSFEELERVYRVEYRAPADARATGLPPGRVDFICSTATMEHIQEPDLRSILAECVRIASPDARFSFIIDYHDHYGTADGKITLWNFYRYSDQAWRKFNPPNHYQNRLRHSDHEQIFRDLGLEIVEDERIIPDWSLRAIERVPVHEGFRRYSREDMITAHGKFLLQPKAERQTSASVLP